MNRFSILPERADDFERAWRLRDSHLAGVPGFLGFQLLRAESQFVSMSTWESEDAFRAWTRSDAFRQAHAQSDTRDMHERGPRFSGYRVVLSEPAGG